MALSSAPLLVTWPLHKFAGSPSYTPPPHLLLPKDSSLKLAADHGFVGIDLDWEDPGTTAAIDKGQGLDPAGNPKYGGRTFTKAQAALDKGQTKSSIITIKLDKGVLRFYQNGIDEGIEFKGLPTSTPL